VALIGADFLAGWVEGEALFIVFFDDFFELRTRHRHPVFARGFEQQIDRDPAAKFQR
jgi:hypothetical protein